MDMINIKTETAKLFIVPNSLNRISGIYDGARRVKTFNRMAELSGMTEFSEDDIVVDVWYADLPTLGTDNLIDHGARVTVDGVEYYCHASCTFSMLPIDIFDGKKEGDQIDLVLPVILTKAGARGEDEPRDIEGTLQMKVTLAQKEFRYSSFGSFENVLKKLRDNFQAR